MIRGISRKKDEILNTTALAAVLKISNKKRVVRVTLEITGYARADE
jgi:hypothetical protein